MLFRALHFNEQRKTVAAVCHSGATKQEIECSKIVSVRPLFSEFRSRSVVENIISFAVVYWVEMLTSGIRHVSSLHPPVDTVSQILTFSLGRTGRWEIETLCLIDQSGPNNFSVISGCIRKNREAIEIQIKRCLKFRLAKSADLFLCICENKLTILMNMNMNTFTN